MIILYSKDTSPLILDSLTGHNLTHDILTKFLKSDSPSIHHKADTKGSAKPDFDELLNGLFVNKGSGAIKVNITPDRWITIEGSPDNLKLYLDQLKFAQHEESKHHHPELSEQKDYWQNSSMKLVIEANSDYLKKLSAQSYIEPQGPNRILLYIWPFLLSPLLCGIFFVLAHHKSPGVPRWVCTFNKWWWIPILLTISSGYISFIRALPWRAESIRGKITDLISYSMVIGLALVIMFFVLEILIHGT